MYSNAENIVTLLLFFVAIILIHKAVSTRDQVDYFIAMRLIEIMGNTGGGPTITKPQEIEVDGKTWFARTMRSQHVCVQWWYERTKIGEHIVANIVFSGTYQGTLHFEIKDDKLLRLTGDVILKTISEVYKESQAIAIWQGIEYILKRDGQL